MHNERQLKRSKSENFKIAAKPLLQYMRTWGPFVAYMAGLVVAVAMAAVPAVASLQNAPTLFSSWASANIADRVQVQLYTCGLIMFVIQSHLIMFQTMFRWRQASDRLQSAEIVRKQTPAVAGFYIGCAIALLSGLLPMPAHGEPVLEIVLPVLAPTIIHAFASSTRPLFESRQIGVQRMVQAVGWFVAVIVTFQFVVASGVAASDNHSTLEAIQSIRAAMVVFLVCAVVFGWSVLACVSSPRQQQGLPEDGEHQRCTALFLANGLASVAMAKLIGSAVFIISLRVIFPEDRTSASFGVLAGVLMMNAMYLAAPVELQQAHAGIEMNKAFASAQLTISATRNRILPGILAALRHLPVPPRKMSDMSTALAVAESRVAAAHSIASAAQLGVMRATATVHNHIGQPIRTSLGQFVDGMLLGVVQDWSHDGVDVLVDCSSIRKAWGVQLSAQAYPFLQVVNEAINRAGTDILIYAEERPPILHATVSVRKSSSPKNPATLMVSIVQHIRALSDADIDELQSALGARTSTDQRWSHLALASGALRSAGGSVRIVGTRCEDMYENGWYCVIATVPLGHCAEQTLFDCCVTSASDRVLGQPLGGEVMMHVAAGLDFCSQLAAIRSGHVAVASSIHAKSQRKRSAGSIASAAQFALQNRERGANSATGSDRVMSATSLLDLDSSAASLDTNSSDKGVEQKPISRATSGEAFGAIVEGEGSSDSESESMLGPLPPGAQLSAGGLNPPGGPLQQSSAAAGDEYKRLRSSTTRSIAAAAARGIQAPESDALKSCQSSDLDEELLGPELAVRRSTQPNRSGEWVLEEAASGSGIFGSGSGGSLLKQVHTVRLKGTQSGSGRSFILNTASHLTDTASSEDSIEAAAAAIVRTVTGEM